MFTEAEYSDSVMICGYIGFNGYNVFSLLCEFMSQQCQKQENPLRVKIYNFSYNLKDFKLVLSYNINVFFPK